MLEWKVGVGTMGNHPLPLPDGDLYRLRYEALKDGNVVETKKGDLFAIDTCRG